MDLAGNILMALSGLLFALGVIVFAAFRNDSVDEAREKIAVSRPIRFYTYRIRSGHGRHALA